MRSAQLTFRLMEADEAVSVCKFVNDVFDRSVAPLYNKKGLHKFKDYNNPEAMSLRIRSDHFVLLAEKSGRITGMIEVRDHHHVSLLFVELDQQGQGLGKELLRRSLEICLSSDPDLREITVNSSPNAVSAYERMGFETTGMEQNIKGVRSTPMRLKLLGPRGNTSPMR